MEVALARMLIGGYYFNQVAKNARMKLCFFSFTFQKYKAFREGEGNYNGGGG